MINIPGYQILALIYESSNSIVYRGRREQSNQPVILKFLKQDYPTPVALNRYKQEYDITCALKLSGVVRAYELLQYQNTLVMVLEDFGGESLRILMTSQRFTLFGFLNIAIKIAESLGELHTVNVIHKDINPSNIVFNPVTGRLKLIDFSISTVLNRETPTLKNPNVLEGTFPYMSPEQTGRMNRLLDYRTDFYSLGITFYELLTQKVPFTATDAMELVHCHIAKQPIPPDEVNVEVPKIISDIVMKLLAKNAEERYQSAFGLKADLEECLKQLQTQGNIENFPLGRFDISDKFQIPQKLYGRTKEIETLMSAFDRVTQGYSEMMLVKGYSGIGKSALVKEIYKPITRQRGYFIAGKFDQFQRSIPYSAVVIAFSELVRLLLTESEDKLNQWRSKILGAFGPNGQIIIDVIPEVELIVGPQPPVEDLKPAEAQNRFNLVFQNFIKVFCDRQHPLVIFLDDLQWADSATLKLIDLMMADSETQYLFFIGAYRDNEVSSTHPLIMMLDSLRKEGVKIQEISLSPLDIENVTHIISDTLHTNDNNMEKLAELVVHKTEGNPFFVNEFLKTLYQEQLLTFTPPSMENKGGWQWDVAQIEKMGITDNVVELMINKLRKLPNSTQQVLRLVACLGNQFDLNTLCLIYEKQASETFHDLWPAIQEGLILPTSDLEDMATDMITMPLLILNYKFLHDRVQQAAYSLIEDDKKKSVHLKIGRLLLANTPAEYRADRIFELVDHLNVAMSLIEDKNEQLELAQLNLEAGKKAKDATAYGAAKEYLTAGMDILNGDIWAENYDLAFALYKERAEIEYLNGNFEKSEEFIQITLEKSNSVLEKAEVYNLLIVQLVLRSKYEEAVIAGKKALAMLGLELPENNLEAAIQAGFAEATANLGDREVASLIDMPEMAITEKRVALELLTNFLTPVYLTNPSLWMVSVLKGVNISLQYGAAPESCLCYCNYGILLSGMFGEYQKGYEFGILAAKLTERANILRLQCKAYASLANVLNYWFKHIKESNVINTEGYQIALQCGDLEYAGYALHNKIINAFFQGKNLGQIREEVPKYLQFTEKTKNQLSSYTLRGMQLTLANLQALTDDKLSFDSKSLNEAEYLESCQQNQNFYSLGVYQVRKLQIYYIYGNLPAALEAAASAEKLLPFIAGILSSTDFSFYNSLLLAAIYNDASAEDKKVYWEKLEKFAQQMKIWADNCPENFLHKYLLVTAEMARISGKGEEAIELYDQAIESAKNYEFIQNEALANEIAAKFWLAKDKPKYAKIHLREAYYGYQNWGAIRKATDLAENYPQILTKNNVNIPSLKKGLIPGSTYTSESNGSGELELAAVMKASQAISGEIVLDKLLNALMKILIENAGAQKGFLILPRDGKLLIVAEASVDESVSVSVQQFTPIDDFQDLPISVIKYVERTKADVVLSDALREGQFTKDNYISDRQLKSVLCTPIVNQGQLIGILYLENNLSVGVFTPDRLEVLRLLSAQAAISLENALLYASLEQKVTERTQELNEKNGYLSQTLQELRRTQAQLIQTEKMSSLGQMVAGIAHEINNPVSFIYGNISPAAEYVQDLLDLIDLYQENYPEPAEEIQNQIEDIDLEFLVEDLHKLLDSMKSGAERIRNIVLSLRNFSRLDEAEMKPVDIHEGIDSTVMLLMPRLKAKGAIAAIEVIKKYNQLPKVVCYASQMNQVFMNILSNAIDALQDVRNQEGKATLDKQPIITISTISNSPEAIEIHIIDNGCGMPEDVKNKIFDPFFTTKPVGSGTGLGLSITYQIIVDKHGGQLNCISTAGEGTEFIITIPTRQPDEKS